LGRREKSQEALLRQPVGCLLKRADLKSLFLAVKPPQRQPQERKKKRTNFRLAEYDHHDHRERNHA
jgi:hypothetical protein